MMHEKYTKKMMEIKKVGGYVERLTIIENDMALDVDEGLLDRYVSTLLEYCIDRINRVYIEGEKKYNSGYDCCEHSNYYDYVTGMNKDKEEVSARQDTIDYRIDCDEFGNISDVVTQSNECNENGGI